jgi:hypothetical protein
MIIETPHSKECGVFLCTLAEIEYFSNFREIIYMKYILLVLSFCVSVMQAQVHKFIYQYKYKTDSLSEHYDEVK